MSSGPLTLEQTFHLAVAHHQAGRLDQAEALYRQILAVAPEQPNTLHLLGVIAHQRGRSELGADLVARALAGDPDNPSAHSNLGEIHKALCRWEEARRCHERALALAPDFADAHNNLGTVCMHFGEFDAARRCFERAVALQPRRAEAHYNLGVAVGHLASKAAARAHYERALALRPDYPEALNNLGGVLLSLKQAGQACGYFRRALALQPDFTQAHDNLGVALMVEQRFSEARGHCERALALDPAQPHVHHNLGFIFQQTGQPGPALASYRRALALDPGNARTRSSLIHTLQLCPATTPADVRAECERWDHHHAAPLRAEIPPHRNAPDPARRLRVGYVSPDFWDHPVSHFVAPLWAAHDHARHEVHAYANGGRADAVRERLRGLADHWHEVAGLSDQALADQVRADGIDVLVDLTVHTDGNYLLAFARQPAPVQVSWLGYAGTTGLPGIGYRLTDACIDPPGAPGAWSAEEPVRLPDSWCCYEPPAGSPPVGGLPTLRAEPAGTITFGALNHFGKHHEGMLRLWGRILAAVPGSRLLMFCPDAGAQERARWWLAQAGVGPDRVKFIVKIPKTDYLRLYGEWIDLALDPSPHNGMTTTCDALWMGVPVVTLPGVLPVARTGLSLLTTVGLPEMVARDEDDYVRIAAGLARDPARLAAVRAGLRGRMQASALMDAPRFARHVESAYRAMWERWCRDATKHTTAVRSAAWVDLSS